jgi:single-strand DNA-binding protein
MLIGRLGRDPELRYTQENTAVATLNLATSESWKDKQSGERKERTEWHRIVVWGRQAENCERFLSKGRLVFVEGTLQTRDWLDKEGNKRYTTEIVAKSVQFLDSKQTDSGQPSDVPPPKDGEAGLDQNFSDDEIPF